MGLDLEWAAEMTRGFSGVRGRFESVNLGQGFSVIVDFAHTPDSLRNVLVAARKLGDGKLISVFGCGGDRDRTKRPRMGAVSRELADFTIVTSDNPRSEEPSAITAEIAAGMGPVDQAWTVILDRRSAIRHAVAMAAPGDVLVIAGKGHETYQIFRDRTIHFDDVEEARQAIGELMKGV
ncbi:MAG: UDP-N-acetylmuramoyl-L-alanyl-D-glutamate--LD-lysine ligase [Firmicutes bacterium ADurb.Bin506]|nr:MAG: UDP-N-acetylmuramoyl-L-alanyl-D-glutamate--LD-lysine ligase [Firmicutes bacterium ADurb.Bin506]